MAHLLESVPADGGSAGKWYFCKVVQYAQTEQEVDHVVKAYDSKFSADTSNVDFLTEAARMSLKLSSGSYEHATSLVTRAAEGQGGENISQTLLRGLLERCSHAKDHKSCAAVFRILGSSPGSRLTADDWVLLIRAYADRQVYACRVVGSMINTHFDVGSKSILDEKLTYLALEVCESASDRDLAHRVWAASRFVRAKVKPEVLHSLYEVYLKLCRQDAFRLASVWKEVTGLHSNFHPSLFCLFAEYFCEIGESHRVPEIAKQVLNRHLTTDVDFWLRMVQLRADLDIEQDLCKQSPPSAGHLAAAYCWRHSAERSAAQVDETLVRDLSVRAEKYLHLMLDSSLVCSSAWLTHAKLGMDYCLVTHNSELGHKLWHWAVPVLASLGGPFARAYVQLCAGHVDRLAEAWKGIASCHHSLGLSEREYADFAVAFCREGRLGLVGEVVSAVAECKMQLGEKFWSPILSSCQSYSEAETILKALLSAADFETQLKAFDAVAKKAPTREDMLAVKRWQGVHCAKVLESTVGAPDLPLTHLMLECSLFLGDESLAAKVWFRTASLRSNTQPVSLANMFHLYLGLCSRQRNAALFRDVFDEAQRCSVIPHFYASKERCQVLVEGLCSCGLPGTALDVLEASSVRDLDTPRVWLDVLRACTLPSEAIVVERIVKKSKSLAGHEEEKLVLFDVVSTLPQSGAVLNINIEEEILKVSKEVALMDGVMQSTAAAGVAMKWSLQLNDTALARQLLTRVMPLLQSSMADSPGAVQTVVQFAQYLLANGNTELVMSAWNALNWASDESVFAKNQIIVALSQTGSFDTALSLLRASNSQAPDFTQGALFSLLQLCVAKKNLPVARECHELFMQLSTRASAKILASEMLAWLSLTNGQFEDASHWSDAIHSHCAQMINAEDARRGCDHGEAVSVAMATLKEAGDVALAERLWKWSSALWARADVKMRQFIRDYLLLCCAARRPDLALDAWHAVCSTNVTGLNSVLLTLLYGLAPLEGEGIDDLFDRLSSVCNNDAAMAALMAVFALRNNRQKAWSLFEQLEARPGRVSTLCYDSAIDALAVSGRCQDALDALSQRGDRPSKNMCWSILRAGMFYDFEHVVLKALQVLRDIQVSYSHDWLVQIAIEKVQRVLHAKGERSECLEELQTGCDGLLRQVTIQDLPYPFVQMSLPPAIQDQRFAVLRKIYRWQIAMYDPTKTPSPLLRMDCELLAVAYAVLCGKRHIQLNVHQSVPIRVHAILARVTVLDTVTISYRDKKFGDHYMRNGFCSCSTLGK